MILGNNTSIKLYGGIFMPDENNRDDEYYINLVDRNIGSGQDFTGRIPTVPLTDAQQEGYSDIYSVQQPVADAAQNLKSHTRKAGKSSFKEGGKA